MTRSEKKNGLRQLYVSLLLAGLALLMGGASYYFNHRSIEVYRAAIGSDQQWVNLLGRVAQIRSTAARTNVPGNDVFESGDIEDCSQRLEIACRQTTQQLLGGRDVLAQEVGGDSLRSMLERLDTAAVHLKEETRQARAIFAQIEVGDRSAAESHMSAMDHAFYGINDSLDELAAEMRSARRAKFELQENSVAGLRQAESWIGIMTLLMVSLLCVYGWNLQRSSKCRERELGLYKRAVDAHAIVAITDRKGRITYVNEKFVEISGYSKENLIGQDHRLLNSGHHSKPFFGDMYRTIHSGLTWKGEIRNRAKDGSLYWVDTTIVPETGADGAITGFIALRKEITEFKHTQDAIIEARDQAEVASRVKSEFLANMSHEIRTPMTAILGFADLLSEEGLAPAVRCEYVATIQRNGEHLLTIINDILDLSKIEAGKMTVERIRVSVVAMIDEVVSLMRVRADGKGMALRVEYITPVPEAILSDLVRLRQILMNLVGNAIKFTDQGSVTLSVAHLSDGDAPLISVAVRDTGIGMTEEQVARLFAAFSQADTTTTRQFGGTGLGLVISQRLAEMLGGEITVKSVPGEGSTFTLLTLAEVPEGVPVVAEHGLLSVLDKNDQAGASEPETPLASCHILLAEDGPDNQLLISFVLRKAGARVEIAKNGRLAVEAALDAEKRGEPFDLILMDMQMPEMDGLAATAALRSQGATLPIVALTAHAMESDRERCLNSGCDGFATKPIDRPELIDLCHRLGCE